jgi:hypothetical protein
LADIDFQHFLQAGHGLLGGEIAEIVHKPLENHQQYHPEAEADDKPRAEGQRCVQSLA